MTYILAIILGFLTAIATAATYFHFRTHDADLLTPRLARHIPDPRDTEIEFLRDMVQDLTAKLQGVNTATRVETASLFRDHLLGASTGLPNTPADPNPTDPGPDFPPEDEPDWTDALVPDFDISPPPDERFRVNFPDDVA